MFSAKKITFRQLQLLFAAVAATGLLTAGLANAAPSTEYLAAKSPAKGHEAAPAKPHEAAGKKDEKKEAAKVPEVEITNAVPVTPEELVAKPHEYLGKNVKFTGKFFAFSNLALDYKPAYRSSKTHLSLLILRPGTHVPLSELKLAMMIPKEKDPETELLAKLKDGDEIEIVGKEFSTALDDPWVEVFKLKKLSSAKPEEKEEKKAEASTENKSDKSEKSDKAKTESPAEKSEKPGTTK